MFGFGEIHIEYGKGARGLWEGAFDVLPSVGLQMEMLVKNCKKRGKKEALIA